MASDGECNQHAPRLYHQSKGGKRKLRFWRKPCTAQKTVCVCAHQINKVRAGLKDWNMCKPIHGGDAQQPCKAECSLRKVWAHHIVYLQHHT